MHTYIFLRAFLFAFSIPRLFLWSCHFSQAISLYASKYSLLPSVFSSSPCLSLWLPSSLSWFRASSHPYLFALIAKSWLRLSVGSAGYRYHVLGWYGFFLMQLRRDLKSDMKAKLVQRLLCHIFDGRRWWNRAVDVGRIGLNAKYAHTTIMGALLKTMGGFGGNELAGCLRLWLIVLKIACGVLSFY